MAKGIRGKDIYKVKRIDDKTLDVIMNNGNIVRFVARMCDYDDCDMSSEFIRKENR